MTNVGESLGKVLILADNITSDKLEDIQDQEHIRQVFELAMHLLEYPHKVKLAHSVVAKEEFSTVAKKRHETGREG